MRLWDMFGNVEVAFETGVDACAYEGGEEVQEESGDVGQADDAGHEAREAGCELDGVSVYAHACDANAMDWELCVVLGRARGTGLDMGNVAATVALAFA